MWDLLSLIRWLLLDLVRSRRSLEAENLALRHQLNVLHRSAPKRPVLSNFDRLIFVCLYRIAPRPGRRCDPRAGDCYPLAPSRLSLVLAVEVSSTSWKATGVTRSSAR